VRGLAALWVFVYHAWLSVGPQRLVVPAGDLHVDLTPLASAGWAGVDAFYVLSGFLLWSIFDAYASGETGSPPLARYAQRRALRILPPYYAQIALLALIGATTSWIEAPTLPVLVLDVTLTQSFSFEHFQAVNNVWWTLSTEAQFYVLLPLLALAVRRCGWPAVLAGGWIVMLAWRVLAFDAFRSGAIIERVWIVEQLPGRIDQFLIGMFASHLARSGSALATRLRHRLVARDVRLALVAVGPIVLVALAYRLHVGAFYLRYWEGHPWLYAWHSLAGIAVAASLYALAIRPDRRAAVARPCSALVGFGTISYSFYLWHEIALRLLGAWCQQRFGTATLTALGVNAVVGFALSLAVAAGWYAAFERPFLRARARLR
jgi:peptidoglycan/LPS O-acetylase OafA/YrhL